jgi:hypothetical protein
MAIKARAVEPLLALGDLIGIGQIGIVQSGSPGMEDLEGAEPACGQRQQSTFAETGSIVFQMRSPL